MDKYIDKTNWPTTMLAAKEFALQALGEMKYKAKIPALTRAVEGAASVERLQYIVINAIMSGEGLRVLK